MLLYINIQLPRKKCLTLSYFKTKMLFSLCTAGDKSVVLPAKGLKMKFQKIDGQDPVLIKKFDAAYFTKIRRKPFTMNFFQKNSKKN